MSCGECVVISLYFMCCSGNGYVCLVCCVFDSVCELFSETICNMFGCCCYYYCVVNKQFELLEFVIDSVYVDLQYDEISVTFTAGSVSLCCVCSHVVVFGMSVRLSWYLMWMRWLL